MAASYNRSAWFYDRLSRLVYGRALVNAQVYLLQFVPADSCVLVVGGGTGWILEELAKIHTSGLKITYVEVAPDMMERSMRRNAGQNEVTFINDAVEHTDPGSGFDVVITPFLFDNFTAQTMKTVFGHIHSRLRPSGRWLNADFQLTGKWWQIVFLRAMFIFFRLVCNIEASALPDIEKQFKDGSYYLTEQRFFYGDFVVARAYQKITES
ncbi:MAG TPA: class I SAM-dependent methyltransferase [Mucilaginibacter sp.]|nr:class I SAM-dependent methyltransferase [Mucilaginibacter sp.]